MIIGVDPGLSGALVIIEKGSIIDYLDMPTSRKEAKRELKLDEIAQWVDCHAKNTTKAIIEKVHAMPGQGVTSMFRFGDAFGAVRGIIAANFIPIEYVTPRQWKKTYNLSSDKGASRRKAASMFPKQSGLFARVKDDGRAEAALIASYQYR